MDPTLFVDGQSGVLIAGSPTTTIQADPITGVAGYSMIREYVSNLLAQSPGLRNEVKDPSQLAECMLQQGYAANQIPLGQPNDISSTTLISPEQRLAPMLTYLVELCTGIPSGSWVDE